MRAVVQRVSRASVRVEGEVIAHIGPGLLVLLGIHRDDDQDRADSFNDAARPEFAVPLYECCVQTLGELLGRPVPTGVFGARMEVDLCNDGPVTIVIDSIKG